MRYAGGKHRLSKYIAPIIKRYREPGQLYVEPFVGGCNMFDKFENPRLGCDANKYIIEMWKASAIGWVPDIDITESVYKNIKENMDKYDPAVVGFAGCACSFGGKWFGGYARGVKDDELYFNKTGLNNIIRQGSLLHGSDFLNIMYKDLQLQEKSIIYCDPPYNNTTCGYSKTCFDSEEFYQWCRDMAMEGHTVFVSEYSAPKDFEVVFEKTMNKIMDARSGAILRTEKLYLVKDKK